MIKVIIIIVHYKDNLNTLECLNSLKKANIKKFSVETLIIDNSGNGSLEKALIRDKLLNIQFLNPKENLGFATGNNLGIETALRKNPQYIILLNNDTIVSPDFLNTLIGFSQRNQETGLVSPKIYFAPGYEFHQNKYSKKDRGKVIWYAGGKIDWANVTAFHIGVDEVDRGQFNTPISVDFATGCCLLIKREVIDRIGVFDNNYFLYFEDVDYCIRARIAGFNIKYCPDAFIWHKNATSSGKPGSNLHLYYQTRNRLYFGMKYGNLKTKMHLLVQAIKSLFGNDKLKSKASRDYFLNNMGKGSYNAN